MITIVFIAFGVAMDAFAVSLSSGASIRRQRFTHALRIATAFGVFQALMPTLGWLGGLGFRDLISGVDHWIAFGLLAAIGGKMLYESTRMASRDTAHTPPANHVLLVLAVATSIDALAVGVSFALLDVAIATAVAMMGLVTFGLSLVGVMAGSGLGALLKRKAEVVGGLVLIAMGIKILAEHLI